MSGGLIPIWFNTNTKQRNKMKAKHEQETLLCLVSIVNRHCTFHYRLEYTTAVAYVSFNRKLVKKAPATHTVIDVNAKS